MKRKGEGITNLNANANANVMKAKAMNNIEKARFSRLRPVIPADEEEEEEERFLRFEGGFVTRFSLNVIC